MAVKFTDDQQRVIDLRNCNILVSAAAGSGKTAVLVERILTKICDSNNPADIDRMLIVTFTNAAAAQMRERISKVLHARIELEPENLHLQRQLLLLHNAQITTIDSFCLYLIRNHFQDIGLDPDFRTADEGEMKLLRQDVLENLLEEAFLEKNPAFLHCVECLAAGGREKQLEEMILSLYNFAMSYPWPKEWLLMHRNDYEAQSIQESDWYPVMADMVQGLLKEALRITQESMKICDLPAGPYMYAPALEADRELLEALEKSAADPEKMYIALNAVSYARLAAKKDSSVLEEHKEQVKKNRERVKHIVKELTEKFFYASPAQWTEDMRDASRTLQGLTDLTLAFMEKLEAKKREKNLLDFHDMEHMALQILLHRQQDGSVLPSAAALAYREHFQEILIDEYQDSNLVQEYLLKSVSGEDDGIFNRFMVGDVKQSIYKFRLARPELFFEKFDTYQKNDGDCVRVDLKKNFRSRRQVTDCVNDVFFRLMHKGLGGVEYDQEAALDPGAEYPVPETEEVKAEDSDTLWPDPYEPELLIAPLVDGDDEKQAEALAIAARIKSLVGRLPVRDEKTGLLRPARFGDIVILLRAPSGWDEVFSEVLTNEQIPVHVTSKTGYFAAQEVQNVLHFLRVLNNPLQDIPMFGVLHSPYAGFTDTQIALLKSMDRNGKKALYDCMVQMAEAAVSETVTSEAAVSKDASVQEGQELADKCAELLGLIERYRKMAVYLPIHTLLERFLEETGYLYMVTAMPGGAQRRLNVEMLLARAESYEKTSYTGLFHFVRYMEQLEKYDVDFGTAGAMDENADVVRIMSIHKSKGLEFPICFVSGLSKHFNRQDGAGAVIWDMDLGLACDCIDPVARTRKTTVKKAVLSRKLRMDSLGEELRVLYVAMTRPQEKLIMTASCKADKLPEENPEGICTMAFGSRKGEALLQAQSAAQLMEGGSFYDWILPVWQQCGRKLTLMHTSAQTAAEVNVLTHRMQLQERLFFNPAYEGLDQEDIQALNSRLSAVYAHENLKDLFVKTTVSELKKAAMQEEAQPGAELFAEPEVIPYLPKFISEKEEDISGTVRGSAYHRVLECFPFAKKDEPADWSIGEVAQEIERQKQSGSLKESYAQAVNPAKIRRFLQSGLAKRMADAQRKGVLYQEQPFVLGISAKQLKPELPEEETVLIQGIIDVFFEEDDALVLVDYKTDRVNSAQELTERYRVQLDYYEQALVRLWQKPVKERIIYSLALQEEIFL